MHSVAPSYKESATNRIVNKFPVKRPELFQFTYGFYSCNGPTALP